MANGYEGKAIKDIAKEAGLVDLPLKTRGAFAQALKAEGQGDHAIANVRLNAAVEAEEAQGGAA